MHDGAGTSLPIVEEGALLPRTWPKLPGACRSRQPMAALPRAGAGTLMQADGTTVARSCQLCAAGINTCEEYVEVILGYAMIR